MAGVSWGAICAVFAFVLFVVGAFYNPSPRYSLRSAGLAFFVLAHMLGV